VTVGDQLCIHYNDQNYYLDVREVQPPHPSSAACIIETDCYVDFEPPPGYKEPSVSDAATSQGTLGNIGLQLTDKRGEDFVPPAYTAFSGCGASLGYVCEE
jgi:ubiquitin fusion degradation protein 1